VNRAPTHTKINSSASPSVVGQAVTLTATVTSPVGTPGGSVVFYDGTTQLGTAPLDATGQATLTTKSFSAAHHSLTAYYVGDTNFAPANSPVLDQLVNALTSVSGHVYKDLTGDGMSADDAPMSGVAIQLFRDSNANGKFDANDSLVATTTSNAAGAYSFTGLQPGEYFVQEATPSGYVRTLPTVSSYYVFNGDYNIAVSNDDFDNFAICTCKSDLKSYYFTDGWRRISDLRGNTHNGDTVSVTFTVKAGESDEFHLVVYSAPDATFNASDASQQQVIQSVGGTYSAGTYTLTVKLPKTGHYQIDFICGSVIQHFGPADSNIFYTPQGRLISADNE
jgi:hypothetical protein